jgi:hypothetical protein
MIRIATQNEKVTDANSLREVLIDLQTAPSSCIILYKK